MKTHDLKIRPVWFRLQREGLKPFEVRRDDRDFQVGDRLLLREITEGLMPEYTGQTLLVEVTCALDDSVPGIQRGYVLLGTRHVEGHQS
ncbi:DUF3850 domain-containing protein [Chitinolyticbacter meiyuanensis]|uniref:DUF3850 domain-containing protein n=1 Tax=Chitinolyticbacter meiyuanensis TaxID=682798 RepID=UPI0011E5C147|nr:DUF3850 domain-containing protein [Chitinolyticbacter meiyuanensis]